MVKGKISVPPPTKRETKDAGKQLPKGHSSAGRVLAEESKVASKTPPKGKK
jgi:hypothetical protein